MTVDTRNATVDWMSKYYALCGSKDIDGAMEYWDTDGELRFANEAPLFGREAIRTAFKGFVDMWAKETHTLTQVWELPDNVVIFELNVHFEMHDGREFAVRGMAYNRISGEQFLEQRTYVDMSPIWAAAAEAALAGAAVK